MRHVNTTSGRRLGGVVALTAALGLGWLAGRSAPAPSAAAQDRPAERAPARIGRDIVRISPQSGTRGRPIHLRTGEANMIQVLQDLADSNGRTVLLAGGIPTDARVTIDRDYTELTLADAVRLLEGEGLYLTEEVYRGEKIFWAQPRLERSSKRGGLVRRGEPREDDDGAAGESRPSARRESDDDDSEVAEMAGGDPALRLWQTGSGRERRYLIQFETPSREQAVDVLSLIRAFRDSEKR